MKQVRVNFPNIISGDISAFNEAIARTNESVAKMFTQALTSSDVQGAIKRAFNFKSIEEQSMNLQQQTDAEVMTVINRFNDISAQIELQRRLIWERFGVSPQYVILGTDCVALIQSYAKVAEPPIGTTSYQDFLNRNFGLTGIADTTLWSKTPKDFIQVVVPSEAYK